MKIRYKGEYYIACEPTPVAVNKYTCRAWKYRTGKEVKDNKILSGISMAILNKRSEKIKIEQG